MLDWLERIYYTCLHLAKIHKINATLFIGFLGYTFYNLLRLSRPFLQAGFEKSRALFDQREEIWERLRLKLKQPGSIWKKRRSFDWSMMVASCLGLVKKALLWLPIYLALWLGNIAFRLIYLLPFVKRDRKRFNKEMKPILHFKSFRSFGYMGIAFSAIAFMVTNYLVTVLRAAIRFLYLMMLSIKDSSQAASFDLNSLRFQQLFNAKVFVIAPILAFPLFTLGLIVAWRSAWVNFEQYRDYNNNEEGDDRFATEKEVHQQYKKIPNKTLTSSP